MIEIVLLNYLKEVLSVDVFMEIPPDPPETYVRIEKTGSSEEEYIETATFALQSYADSMYEAALLNREVIDKMRKIIKLDEVFKVKLNSDYNFTDPSTKKYRYQCIFDITY
ncbi:MAG: hypothetical protein ACLT8P_04095 [Holdemanella porci]|mgnify:FL=1|uniref:hypothetical protein n=1 Tax=Holdemanella porci TaxID=2652276 RepID=UPI0039964B87